MIKDIRALTGVRGVAAVIIVLYHFSDVRLYSGDVRVYFTVPHGYLAVDLFFMLSGFVIALVYRDAFTIAPLTNYLDFWIKRAARLYPAYLAIGVLYVLKIALGLSGENFDQFSLYDGIGNLLMLSGWGLHINPVIGVSWAASAEMGSYVLAPLLIAFIVRGNVAFGIIAVGLSLLAIHAIEASGLGGSGPLDVTSGDSFYPLLRAIAGFALGQAIFRFCVSVPALPMVFQDILVVLILLAIAAVAAFSTADLPVYLLFIPLVAVLSYDGRLARLLFANGPIYDIGLISYSLYLIHPLFVSFAVRVSRHFGGTEGSYLVSMLICMAIIWLLSKLSYRFVEMPARKLIAELLSPKKRDRQRPADRTWSGGGDKRSPGNGAGSSRGERSLR
jgi:peptidoglycan/LPS O-acetylase OafA/YrhL